jgi:phosphoglycerate dehydrogenase-like enzyme
MLDRAAEKALGRVVDLRTVSRQDEATVMAEGQGAVALIARSGGIRVGAPVFDALPSLAVVSSTGSGADCFDVEAATARGIPVLHNPGLAPGPVAEYVIGAMVLLARRLLDGDRWLRAGGDWSLRLNGDATRSLPRGRELAELTLGVVGFGHIGRDVARRAAAAFGIDVVAYDPVVAADELRRAGVRPAADLDQLLAEADIVTVHVPLMPATQHLIDADALKKMKPGAFLINAARGGVVDEGALVDALHDGPLAAAAIDVFAAEPPAKDHPLFGLDNVLVTPHIAGASQEALARLSQGVVDGILAALHGQRPPRMVADVWPPARLDPAAWPLPS